MIEKQIISKNIREYLVQKYIESSLPKGSFSSINLKKTPLGERIIIHTSRPGLIVGRKGENIVKLTETLKHDFHMDNPQIEVAEIAEQYLDPIYVSDHIVLLFDRFGPKRFKSIGYKSLQNIIDAGALGAEIVISGRGVPSSRAKSWRFSAGHLKKSGDISENYVKKAVTVANLRSGSVGIKVSILTPDVVLPDLIKIKDKKILIEGTKEVVIEEKKEEVIKEEVKKERKPRKKKEKVENEIKDRIETNE